MTTGVIDTSALIKFVLPEDHLAAEINITVYDALFCVLAQRQQAPLITADLPLVRRLGSSPIQALTLDQIPW